MLKELLVVFVQIHRGELSLPHSTQSQALCYSDRAIQNRVRVISRVDPRFASYCAALGVCGIFVFPCNSADVYGVAERRLQCSRGSRGWELPVSICEPPGGNSLLIIVLSFIRVGKGLTHTLT
jgi:hypothetical protein